MTPDDERTAATIAHYDNQVAKSALTPPATAVPTLVEWLRGQLDEDQRVAEQGLHGHNPISDDDHEDWDVFWSTEAIATRDQREEDWQDSWHTQHCGYRTGEFSEECECGVPARVLAEIAAKRAILNAYESGDNRGLYGGCGDDCEWKALEHAIRLLAQPYRDRPGWQQAWEVAE